jgi:WD40 repeat protein
LDIERKSRKLDAAQAREAAEAEEEMRLNIANNERYHLPTGEEQEMGDDEDTLHGHDGAVNCAEFSPDNKFIASGSVDTFVLVWEADMDKCLNVDTPSVEPSSLVAVQQQKAASGSNGAIKSNANVATQPPPAPAPTAPSLASPTKSPTLDRNRFGSPSVTTATRKQPQPTVQVASPTPTPSSALCAQTDRLLLRR